MSYVNEIEFPFEVGDAYELSPIEMTYVIGRILSLGGECYVDGNTVIVVSMPGKTAPEAKTEEPTPVEPKPEPKPEPAPVEEAPKVEEASAEKSETPIKRARKSNAKTEEPVTDEPVPAPVEE